MSSARAEAAERVRANQDEASTTSHASSSRAGITSSSTSNRATLKPLSLADALARAGGDATRALDEVLAERNQLCLEANRLQTENMRIWNLMRRPKRDPNEAQTAASRTSHEGNSPGPGAVAVAGPSSSRGSPLAAPPLSSSRRRGAGELDSASPSSDGLRERGTPDQDLMSQAQSSSSTSSQPVFAQGGGGTAPAPAPAAAASSTDRGTGSATESTLAPTARSVAGAGAAGAAGAAAGAAAAAAAATSTAAADLRSGDLSQQSSIMQQRAAAQLAARAQSEGHGRRMSFESQDYEAIDGSSAAPSDDEAPQSSFSRSDATAAAAAADETIGPRSSVREPSEASTVAPRSLPSSDSPANTIQRPPPRSQHQQQQQQQQQQQPGEVPTSPTRNTFAHHQAGNGSTSSLSNTARTFPPSPMAANFARSARTMSVESLGGSAPRLDASRLANARLSVAGSNLRSNERGREVISFYIAIDVGAVPSKASSSRGGNVSPSHPQSWRVEKLYSDVLALDARLKQKHGKTAAKRIGSAQLPDRTLFKDHAPSKVDQRKAILDAYLQNLLAISLPDKDDLCTFLCTDVVPTKLRDPQAMTKEGFLTKKGQNMGRWVTRLYRLSGNKLDYYESRGGAHLGSIAVTGAQIGRQQRSATAELDENSYRHAFLILEKRPPSSAAEQPQMVRHVLCAESDDERDEWVDILVRTIAELEKETGQTAALPPSSPTKALSQSRPSAAVKNSGMSISTSSSTTLVQPPNPRSPTRARAEDVSHKHSGSQTGSFGRGSEPALMPASSSSAAAARRYGPQSTHQPPSSGGDTVLPSSSAGFGTGTEMGRSFSDSLQYGSNESMLPSSPPQQQIALAQAHQPALISSTSRGQQRKASQDTYVSAIAPGNSHDSRSAHHATSYDTQRPSTPENKGTATMSGGGAPGGSASKGSSSGNNSSGHGSSGPLRPSISGPMNGAPIPTGFKFGGKDEGGASSSSSSTAIATANNGAVSSTGVGTAAAPSSEGNKKRFWQRFAGGGGGSGGSADKNAPPKKVFGVPLAESIAASNISEGLELPSVVYRCIEYLEKRNAASEEGIYRLSGSSAVIKSLKDRFNAQGDVDLLAPTEPMHDPHAVAGLLKTFFRELPSSVLTSELHLDFMRANDILDRKERVNELGQLVSMLPLPNYSVLRTLCSHLIKIIERQDENKMTMRNVGIVFSPTLGIPAGVFALFLTEFDWVFYTDARGEPAPRLIEEDIIPPDNEELGKESFSSHRSQGREGSVDGSEHFADALSQDFHQSSAESTAGAAAPSTPRARSKKGNRTSWIAGNALHAADGQVHDLGTATSSSRHNRNSLSYNEEEADKLLGGPQGRNRLSSHVEEIDQVDLTGDAADDTLEDEAGGGGGGAQQQLQSPVGDEALHATPAAQLHQRQQQEWAAKASFESLQPPSSAMAGVGSGGGTYSYIPSPMASPRYASSTKSARSREPSASQHDHTLQLPGTSYDQYGRPQAWSSASSSVPASPAGSTRSHRSAPRPPMPSQPSPASSAHHYPQQYGGGGNPRSPPPVS
ncbi:hypothetical protein FA10DRAFT_268403 [Acaromyces ingoldii]|uniref:RhoGAP-domain-containing protein n=1 Tax=Acaromyces ingoldii TaxID=215250 RepID=A0A316YG49_9BASI|nr:hypothetical protein FA10DRAFT_268403 [Acaromyces ingoldii]PWN88189.1 hypothetical protein FA10DRAFT_268403 [Acaromyces ingoldii]